MASATWETMLRQPQDLREILDDDQHVEAAADRLRGKRILLVGTGTSWHAANHGAWLLREAGVEAWPLQAADMALYGPKPRAGDAIVLLTHRGIKRFTKEVQEAAQAESVPMVVISRRGSPAGADLETVENEKSSTFTASHLAALLRVAQLTAALGGDVGDLAAIPGAVEAELNGPPPRVAPPGRLLEYIGAGTNQWTAAEGALKAAEAAFVATEGLAVEQFLHGPSVAVRENDTLICLDGGGPMMERLEEIASAAEAAGSTVHRFVRRDLGEPLSIFPLTVVVQRIAVELSAALGTNPDMFGYDVPVRKETWGAIPL